MHSVRALGVFHELFELAFRGVETRLGLEQGFDLALWDLVQDLLRSDLDSAEDAQRAALCAPGSWTPSTDLLLALRFFTDEAGPELFELTVRPHDLLKRSTTLTITPQLVAELEAIDQETLFDVWTLVNYFLVLHVRAVLLLQDYRFFHGFYFNAYERSAMDFEQAYSPGYEQRPMPKGLTLRPIITSYFDEQIGGRAYRWDIVGDLLHEIGQFDFAAGRLKRITEPTPKRSPYRLERHPV